MNAEIKEHRRNYKALVDCFEKTAIVLDRMRKLDASIHKNIGELQQSFVGGEEMKTLVFNTLAEVEKQGKAEIKEYMEPFYNQNRMDRELEDFISHVLTYDGGDSTATMDSTAAMDD